MPDDINVALLGAGSQGLGALFESARRSPGVRFRAVCDIWEYASKRAAKTMKMYGHTVSKYETYGYTDYREMLDCEKDRLDAVIIATPDWMHAEHAIACMRAGLHVYCEKPISNSIASAKEMIRVARATGKQLQIGHQRRSNLRYRNAIDVLIGRERILGRPMRAYGQWNRSLSGNVDSACHPKYNINSVTLEKHGYDTMAQFLNWRHFREFGGGPAFDLGVHAIDVFNWAFGGPPRSVQASGGADFFTQREWPDNLTALLEYDTPEGVARATYHSMTTNGEGGFYESFRGPDGSLNISEAHSLGNSAMRQSHVLEPKWESLVRRGLLVRHEGLIEWDENAKIIGDSRHRRRGLTEYRINFLNKPSGYREVLGNILAVYDSGYLFTTYSLPTQLSAPVFQPHLENFFDAIRRGTPLSCPGQTALAAAVVADKINQAIERRQVIDVDPAEYGVADYTDSLSKID